MDLSGRVRGLLGKGGLVKGVQGRKAEELGRLWTSWHWGSPVDRVIHVADELVPDVVGIGELREFELNVGVLKIPGQSWLAYDPAHPAERLHCILHPAFREKLRHQMKSVRRTVSIQSIAEAAGGDQARYPLPNVQGVPLGVIDAVIYFTHKKGDGPSEYHHAFGEELAPGVARRFLGTKPVLACDVSGRLWVCSGSARCPLAGITG